MRTALAERVSYPETSTDVLAGLCIEDTFVTRDEMARKRTPLSPVFGSRELGLDEATPVQAHRTGWQVRLLEIQDVPSFKPNSYSAKVLRINPLAVDRVYMDEDEEIVGRDLNVYGSYPEQDSVFGQRGRWTKGFGSDVEDDDLAELRVVLQDAVTSLST